jgi:ABC-type glycerol-3-phosphate transport system substrate-binding protein
MKNLSVFKIVVLGVFSLFIVIGIAVFALSKADNGEISANLKIWGTIPSETFDKMYAASSLKENKNITITYLRKDQQDFDQEFIEALAEGTGPDMVLLREDYIYKHRNKLYAIPYENYNERAFKDKFIEEGELFLTKSGVLAFPLIVDPLVMYWNRDIFTNNLISQPPKYWDQIYPIIEKTTKKDTNANVMQSTIALGEWRNITNAKEILSMLFLQAGTPITSRSGDTVISVLNSQLNQTVTPAQSALNFYTQFSNPTSNTYTWNRSLPSSLNMFLSGNLAMYIGFASEIFNIQQKNENLNFDVTLVPDTRDTSKRTVFAHMYALSITKQSKNVGAAFLAINSFTEPAPLTALETQTNLPPVRRDMLSVKPTGSYRPVFYESALVSRSWIDPNPSETSVLFRDMIESITSGKSKVYEALNRGSQELSQLLK